MPGATARAMRRPRAHRTRKLAGELVWAGQAACGLGHPRPRARGRTALLHSPLRGDRVLRLAKALMALCERCGRRRAGPRVVTEAPLDGAMGRAPVQSAVALGTHAGLVVAREPSADGCTGLRRLGAATVRAEGGRGARPDTRCREDQQRRPCGFRGGPGPRQHGAGRACQGEAAPPCDAVAGTGHLAASHAPGRVCRPGVVGVGRWRQVGAFVVGMRASVIDLLVQGHTARDGPHGTVGVGPATPAPARAGIRLALVPVLPRQHAGQPALPSGGLGRTPLGEQPGLRLCRTPLAPGSHGRTGDGQEPTPAAVLPALGVALAPLQARRVAGRLGVGIPQGEAVVGDDGPLRPKPRGGLVVEAGAELRAHAAGECPRRASCIPRFAAVKRRDARRSDSGSRRWGDPRDPSAEQAQQALPRAATPERPDGCGVGGRLLSAVRGRTVFKEDQGTAEVRAPWALSDHTPRQWCTVTGCCQAGSPVTQARRVPSWETRRGGARHRPARGPHACAPRGTAGRVSRTAASSWRRGRGAQREAGHEGRRAGLTTATAALALAGCRAAADQRAARA